MIFNIKRKTNMKNATKSRLIQIARITHAKWGLDIFKNQHYKTEIMRIAKQNGLPVHWMTLNAGLPVIMEEILALSHRLPKKKVMTAFLFEQGVLEITLANGDTVEYTLKINEKDEPQRTTLY